MFQGTLLNIYCRFLRIQLRANRRGTCEYQTPSPLLGRHFQQQNHREKSTDSAKPWHWTDCKTDACLRPESRDTRAAGVVLVFLARNVRIGQLRAFAENDCGSAGGMRFKIVNKF